MSYFLKLCFALLIVFSALLIGCGASVPTVKPFKMDIQQGNVVTSKMLLQLKPGMTKSQVKFIMGTPLIVDSFHSNRWDYFYQMRQAGKVKEQRRVILEFDKDALMRVRGDVVPEGTAGATTGEPDKLSAPITVEPKPKEKGLLEKLKFWGKDDKPAVETKPSEIKPEAKTLEVNPEMNVKTPESDALEANIHAPSGDAPSMLAVPIEVAPVIEAPKVEPVEVKAPVVEVQKVAPVELPKVEPVKIAPPKAEPPKQVETPKPAPVKLAPVKPSTEEPFSFRIDKDLDATNLETPPAEVAPEVEVKTPAKKGNVEPLPEESSPSFFDRMLEKIGF